MIKYMYISFLT